MKVAVEGKTAELKDGKATWGFNVTKPATATVNIVNSAGSTVYTGTFSVNAGTQNFVWDGRNNAGVLQAERHLHACRSPRKMRTDKPPRSPPKPKASSIPST